VQDADEEIREIKKEVIEARGLIIKSNNLTNSLAADIKSIGKRQVGYERRFNLNSGIAYVLFAALSFVGLKFASDARITEIETDKNALEEQVRELRRDLNEMTEQTEQRRATERTAERFYQMIRAERRAEVVRRYPSIADDPLSPAEGEFFRDTVDSFRLDLSVAAYQSGLGLMRTGRYAEAAEKFEQAIEMRGDSAHIPAVRYNLGRALRRLGRQTQAMVYARQVIQQNQDRDLQDDATWLLSLCAEEVGDIDAAREALRGYLRRWPRSALAPDARARLRDLNIAARRSRT